MKPRSLRIHAKHHAKSHIPAKVPLWTEERVKELKDVVPRDDLFDVTTLDIKSSVELDEAAEVLLTELGRLEHDSKQTASVKARGVPTTKARIVIGLRQTHRDVETGSPRLILLAKHVEGAEGKGTPLDVVKDIMSIAKRRNIPIAAVLSRRKVCVNHIQ